MDRGKGAGGDRKRVIAIDWGLEFALVFGVWCLVWERDEEVVVLFLCIAGLGDRLVDRIKESEWWWWWWWCLEWARLRLRLRARSRFT